MPEAQTSERKLGSPIAINLPGGQSVTAWQEGDAVVLVTDLGKDLDGVMVKLPAPAAAYLAGGLAAMSGVHRA